MENKSSTKTATFGNQNLSSKILSKFSSTSNPIKVDMKFSSQVHSYITKIESAHSKAAASKLLFK